MTTPREYIEGAYYHLSNKGVGASQLFKDDVDYKRFLFSILYGQSTKKFNNVERFIKKYTPETGFPVKQKDLEEIFTTRTVEVVCFCLLPDRFQVIAREKEVGGISSYMQRIMTAHTRYMNIKYNLSGSLFESRYKAAHVKDAHHLLYLSTYIHKTPTELKTWEEKYFDYPWSSLQDYTNANRWGGLLEADIIAEQFAAEPDSNYADFVRTVTEKDVRNEIPKLINPA